MNKFDAVVYETLKEMGIEVPKYKAHEFRKALFTKLADYVKSNGKLSLPGFGSFKLVTTKPRKVKVPTTGNVVEVPSREVIKFKMSKKLY